jgi:pantoate--beta-alanine ligase
MQRIKSISEIQSEIEFVKAAGKSIALVPTMGYLHDGHLSLIDKAHEVADFVIVSVYVNPTQFGLSEDLTGYPRDLESDAKYCEEKGVHIMFCPENEDMYPDGYSTYIEETRLSSVMCGISRPTHFKGVTTIVAKLFNIIQPNLAIFGMKDIQQVAVIRKMVKDLNMQVEIVTSPTVREADGLAMSSRNVRLDERKRESALNIYRAMSEGKKLFDKGFVSTDRIIAEVIHQMSKSRILRVIYVSIVDKETMKPMKEVEAGRSVLCVAVWVEQVRLIDNIEF